jgi:hypothetical protein
MKKIGLLVLAVVFAVGALGVGYAHWSQTLYVDGSVTTGTYLVGFETCSTDDGGTTLDPLTDPAKDVGSTEAELLDLVGDHGGIDIFETLSITLDNVYPGYKSRVDFDIGNGGTVPGNVVNPINIVSASHDTDPPLPIELYETTEIIIAIDWVYIRIAWHSTVQPAVFQIDPCQVVDYYLTFEVLQDNGLDPLDPDYQLTAEGTTVTFEIEIDTVQWNLAPP